MTDFPAPNVPTKGPSRKDLKLKREAQKNRKEDVYFRTDTVGTHRSAPHGVLN